MANKPKFEELSPKEKLRHFRRHLGTYLVMSLFFFVLNAITSPGQWWFYWPMLGWGIGVAMQGLDTYNSIREAREDGLDLDDFKRQRERDNDRVKLPQTEGNYREEDFV